MKRTESELSYQRAAIQGASAIGLMIVLFDTLTADFRQAANALRENDIETRCRVMNHATLVLGQLENWIDLENGGESAQTLSRFYAYLRAKMMEAGITKSAKLIEAQIDMVLHVRSAWQLLDASPPQSQELSVNGHLGDDSAYSTAVAEAKLDRIPFSLSA